VRRGRLGRRRAGRDRWDRGVAVICAAGGRGWWRVHDDRGTGDVKHDRSGITVNDDRGRIDIVNG
jgi:hypothetical protein